MPLSTSEQKPAGAQRVLLVGDFPPPHGGVAVHVEMLLKAIRLAGGEAEVLDIGKGQVPAEGVHPAGSYAAFAAQLASFAARGWLIHVHTSGANPKSWLLAAACAVAGRAAGRPPLITLHSGLGPGWLESSPARRVLAGALLRGFDMVVAVSEAIARMVQRCGVPSDRLLVAPGAAFKYAPREDALWIAIAQRCASCKIVLTIFCGTTVV